ncbi:coniferyl aldehyde dehydrogenase [Candidatus Phycosocius spiralis]|nr:coniferyl aldehyde dehydrogenase [Candidatus Phycosocius spiralis]
MTRKISQEADIIEHMHHILAAQKAAHSRDGVASRAVREDRLDRCIALLVDHAKQITDALSEDFSCRARETSLITEIASSLGPLKYAKAHLAKWMRPEKRKTSPLLLGLFGARAEIHYLPKGVVGIIAPWNFPVNLIFAPLAQVLAAGNRAMIKPSELTPNTSELIKFLISKTFSPEEIAVIPGGPDVGQAFSRLAFDHLVFTGGTGIGRHIMRAAADHLVPLTLELGGKSPVVVSRSADLPTSADRIMAGKTLNAGQICLAPDYLLVPKEKLDSLMSHLVASVNRMYPSMHDNPDYTAIISQGHYDRIMALLSDARAKGAKIVEINPAGEVFSSQSDRKIPPILVLDVTDDMSIMQEEIFGPLLPIKTYSELRDAVSYIKAKPRPLGLYYFGTDPVEQDFVLSSTISGGVTVNDVIFHIAMEDLPFGGIGPSGMGSYHGQDGFKEFSHARAIYHQINKDIGPLKALRPPYGSAVKTFLAQHINK